MFKSPRDNVRTPNAFHDAFRDSFPDPSPAPRPPASPSLPPDVLAASGLPDPADGEVGTLIRDVPPMLFERYLQEVGQLERCGVACGLLSPDASTKLEAAARERVPALSEAAAMMAALPPPRAGV